MRFIHAALATVGTALAVSAPLHHAAFGFVHRAHGGHSLHPDSVVVESVSGERCVVHLGEGRTALVGLTDGDHLAELHAWLMALGRPDTSDKEIAIKALPGSLPDSAKQLIRSGFHDHADVRVLLDWGGSAVHHHGQELTMPTVAVVDGGARHMTARSGMPDSTAVSSIRGALAMAVGDARSASSHGASPASTTAAPPLVRCESPIHST
jgi:hypothetical protein